MSTTDRPLVRTTLPLPDRREGKVRDLYTLPGQPGLPPRLAIVATDRISAFDVILPTPIPGKGRLLGQISARWFGFIRSLDLIADHLISSDADDLPGLAAGERVLIEGRVMIGWAAEVIPIEFVVRGYLAGSGWSEYERRQSICGVALPPGLRRGERLPEPIFTPTTKATAGHDEPIDYEQACATAGRAWVSLTTRARSGPFLATIGFAPVTACCCGPRPPERGGAGGSAAARFCRFCRAIASTGSGSSGAIGTAPL